MPRKWTNRLPGCLVLFLIRKTPTVRRTAIFLLLYQAQIRAGHLLSRNMWRPIRKPSPWFIELPIEKYNVRTDYTHFTRFQIFLFLSLSLSFLFYLVFPLSFFFFSFLWSSLKRIRVFLVNRDFQFMWKHKETRIDWRDSRNFLCRDFM